MTGRASVPSSPSRQGLRHGRREPPHQSVKWHPVREGRLAEFNQRGGINGAVGRALMVKACNLAFRHRPAVRPKQDYLGIGLSGVNNGNSTRQL